MSEATDVTITHEGETVKVEGRPMGRSIVLRRGDSLTIDLEPILAEGMRLQREIHGGQSEIDWMNFGLTD